MPEELTDRLIRKNVEDAWRTIVPPRDDPFGPLPPLMVALTFVTGLVDAFSFLDLGHVFVANVTGNVVFLAFSLAGARGFSIAASASAYGCFAFGSLVGGRLAAAFAAERGRMLRVAASTQVVLVAGATGLSAAGAAHLTDGYRYGLIVLLAVTMGLQNAVARKLAVPDLTTTVLTLTTTGIFADSRAAGGPGSKVGRRLLSIVAMFAGALLGAAFVVQGQRTSALIVALCLVTMVALFAWLFSRGHPSWAQG